MENIGLVAVKITVEIAQMVSDGGSQLLDPLCGDCQMRFKRNPSNQLVSYHCINRLLDGFLWNIGKFLNQTLVHCSTVLFLTAIRRLR
jgi:hypothetical protein